MMRGQSARSGRRTKADEALIADEMRRRREQQNEIETAMERLEEAIASVREKIKKREGLASHLLGFYEEVDKLAKGKALIAATDLIVEHANNIVREAKALIQGDPYLDQVKEFVPAGDNPVYPDVLWVARAVQQALERLRADLKSREESLASRVLQGRTILAALRFLTAHEGRVPTKEQIATIIDNPPGQWFHGSYGTEEFKLERLDNRDIVSYLSEGIPQRADEQQ